MPLRRPLPWFSARALLQASVVPGEWLLRRVRVAIKFLVVGAALFAPLVWMTGSYVSAQRDQVDFSRAELDGVTQLRPLISVYLGAVAARHADSLGLPAVSLTEALAAVDASEVRDRLGTADSWAGVRDALLAASTNPGGRAAQKAWTDAIDLLRRHLVLVGDRSNLTLDPDIDTYYLMDAVQFRLPVLTEAYGSLWTESALTTREAREAERELRLAPISATIARELGSQTEGVTKIVDATAMSAVARTAMDGFRAVRNAATVVPTGPDAPLDLTAIDTHWQAMTDGLDVLLRERVAMLEQRAERAIAVTGAATVVALYLFVVLCTSVNRPVHRTIAALRRAADGEPHEPLPVAGQDELAELSREVNAAIGRIGETQARIEHQATHDMLTGLPNRRFVVAELERLLATPGAADAALCFIDLDRFKSVNDELGHAAGDAALHAVARRLRVLVDPRDVVARLAGDEFVVLLRDAPPDEELATFLWLVIEVLDQPIPVEGPVPEAVIGASIGVARLTPGLSVDEVLHRADAAMYESKRLGGNRHLDYTELERRGVPRVA